MLNPRRVVIAGLLLLSCAATVMVARQAADVSATSDTAVIESYTRLASRGQLTLGTYSRFQWHHPGPLYFFWMVPFYVLSGSRAAGLNAGALVLNLASLALIVWILWRRATSVLAVAVCGIAAVYLVRAAELTVSPWSPHVPVIAMMALLLAAADTMSGTPAMLPAVAALASLAGQTYVGFLPSALAVGVVAFVRTAARAWRRSDAASGAYARAIAGALIVVSVLWMLPLVEELSSRPGNLTQLWTFFVLEQRPGQTFARAFAVWSDMMSGIWRPDFYVALGWRFQESAARWPEFAAVVQLVALVAVATRAVSLRRNFEFALGSLVLMASLLALWSATRIEEAIFDHEVFWISVLGVLSASFLAALAAEVVRGFLRRPQLRRGTVAFALMALLVVAAAVGARELRATVVNSRNPSVESQSASHIAADILRYMRERNVVRPLIRIDQDAWGVAAGSILQLQKVGVPVAVEDDWIAMFTPAFSADGRESTVITIAARTAHVRMLDIPGDLVISSHDPFYAHVAPAAINR